MGYCSGARNRAAGQYRPADPVQQGENMKKLLAIALAAMFATVSVAPAFAAEKKAAKVDCKDQKNKNHKDCKAKK